jgi:hypothetical protein
MPLIGPPHSEARYEPMPVVLPMVANKVDLIRNREKAFSGSTEVVVRCG